MQLLLPPQISIVVPVHNEQESIAVLTDRTMQVISGLSNYRFNILFIDDGSSDNSIQEIEKQTALGRPVGYVQLSKNYGHQSALEAGLATCVDEKSSYYADAIITMDSDLQHPPEEIPAMLKAFEQGAEVVQMQRTNAGENFRGMLSLGYYTFFSWITSNPLVPNAADFRLVSRMVAQQIVNIPGKGKLLRALIPALGFKQVYLPYVQPERKFGKPSYSLFALYELSLHTTFKFSRFPAHFTSISGALLFTTGIVLYFLRVFGVLPDNRHTLFMLLLMLLGGIVLMVGGVICWYLFFILEQVRHDPSYVVKKSVSPPPQNN